MRAARGDASTPVRYPFGRMLAFGISESFSQTFALVVTFLGIGVVVNLLIVYIVAQVLGEHRQNQQRRQQ